MKTFRNPGRAFLAVGIFLLCCGPIAQSARADTNTDNPNTEKLLKQADLQAARLDKDADSMTGLVLSHVTWQAYSDELNRVKMHVNDLGKLIAELQSSRSDASPWQKEAIDRVVPLLREVAANTTNEMKYLARHQDWPVGSEPKYDRWVNQSAKAAHELAGLVTNTVQYDEDQARLADLSDSLQLKTRPTP